MPYIKGELREKWNLAMAGLLEELDKSHPTPVGELNYIFTKIAVATRPGSYTDFNAVIGALYCAKAEFYRRMVAPYEDHMQKKNGDVYDG